VTESAVSRRAIAVPLAGAVVVSWVALDWLAPFRFGLLSVALYAAPVAVAVVAVVAVVAGLLAAGVPFGYLQRAAAPVA